MGQGQTKTTAKISKDELADVQKDSNLTQKDMDDMLKKFSKLANKDGKIPKEKFKDLLSQHYGGTDGTLSRMFMTLFDKDGDSEIDFREFVMSLSFISSKNVNDTMEVAFAAFDLNSDGGISKDELKAVFRTYTKLQKFNITYKKQKKFDEFSLTPKETMDAHDKAEKVYDSIPKADNKQISKEEFLAACSSNESIRQQVAALIKFDSDIF